MDASMQETGVETQDPPRTRSCFHLLLSASVALGILGFFGSVLMYPGEVLGAWDGLTTVWILAGIMIGLNAAFFTNIFLKRTHGQWLVLAGNVASIVAFLVMAGRFFAYTSDNHEPWIMQMSWFIRENGTVIGAFLGTLVFSGASTLAYLIGLVPGFETSKDDARAKIFIIIIGSAFLLFACFNILYRHVSTIWMLALMLVLLVVQASSSVIPAIKLFLARNIEPEIAPARTRFFRATRDFVPPKNPDPLHAVHARLEAAGNERLAFWWFLFTLLFVDTGMLVLLADRYPTDTFNYMMFVAIALVIMLVFVAFSYSRRRSDTLREMHGIRRWKTSWLAFADGFRALAVIVASCGSLYFFRYPVYIPDVLAKEALFALGGCMIFMISRKSQAACHAFYMISLLLVIANYYLFFTDAARAPRRRVGSTRTAVARAPLKYNNAQLQSCIK